MRSVRSFLVSAVVALLCLAGMAVPAVAEGPSATQALERVGSQSRLIEKAVPSTADDDSAAQTEWADVPTDPVKGVSLRGSDN